MHLIVVHGTLIAPMSLMSLILTCRHVCINVLSVNISPIDHGHASVLIYHYDLVNNYNLIIDARLLLCARVLRWWKCCYIGASNTHLRPFSGATSDLLVYRFQKEACLPVSVVKVKVIGLWSLFLVL